MEHLSTPMPDRGDISTVITAFFFTSVPHGILMTPSLRVQSISCGSASAFGDGI